MSLLGAIRAENELAAAYNGYGTLLRALGRHAEGGRYLAQAEEIFGRLGTRRAWAERATGD